MICIILQDDSQFWNYIKNLLWNCKLDTEAVRSLYHFCTTFTKFGKYIVTTMFRKVLAVNLHPFDSMGATVTEGICSTATACTSVNFSKTCTRTFASDPAEGTQLYSPFKRWEYNFYEHIFLAWKKLSWWNVPYKYYLLNPAFFF